MGQRTGSTEITRVLCGTIAWIAVFSICMLTVIGPRAKANGETVAPSAHKSGMGSWAPDGSSARSMGNAGTLDAARSVQPVMYASEHDWTQSPSVPLRLAVGDNVVRLVPCPRGLMIADPPGLKSSVKPHEYVYVRGTGKPEAVKVDGGTGHSGDTSCTIRIATKEEHKAGYVVGSATGGIKEASEDSMFLAEPYGFGARRLQGGTVIIDSRSSSRIYAPVYIEATNQIIRSAGGTIDCYVSDDDCMKVGDGNSNDFWGIQLEHLRFHPNVPSGTTSALYVNGNKTTVRDITTLYSSTGGTFGHIVTVCDDQAFTLDGLNYVGIGLRSDKDFVGSAVFAPGPFNRCSAVGWLKNMQISAQCVGNGVDWQSGNSLHVSDSVIQGFAQFGVRSGTMRGGYQATQLDDTYMEVGGCSNPDYTAAGLTGLGAAAMAGVIQWGSPLVADTNMAADGQEPQFATGGGTAWEYWVLIEDSAHGYSMPFRFGQAAPRNRKPFLIGWPRVTGTGTITYDVLKTPGTGYSLTAPYGTGAYALATGLAQCAGTICTYTDNQPALATYTVPGAAWTPDIRFWPGLLVLMAGSEAFLEGVGTSNIAGIISSSIIAPSVYAKVCAGATPGVYVSCVGGNSAVNNNSPIGSLLLQTGAASGGGAHDLKGRLNFFRTTGTLDAGHLITLVDTYPQKTLADANHRPTNDDNDTFIGLDVPIGGVSLQHAQLAFGAPNSISNYIGSRGDGKNWKERLTAKEKMFAVPIVVKSGNTLTLGSGSAISQIKIYATTGIPAERVSAQSCLDVKGQANGLSTSDQITGVTPPKSLGNLSVHAYPLAADTVTLHFCNPSPSAVNTPAGSYSFLAIH